MTEQLVTLNKFYDKEAVQGADTSEHTLLRVILKFVMISYLTLVAFLMVADCISYLRLHGYRPDTDCPSNFNTSLEAEHFRKHHNMHM